MNHFYTSKALIIFFFFFSTLVFSGVSKSEETLPDPIKKIMPQILKNGAAVNPDADTCPVGPFKKEGGTVSISIEQAVTYALFYNRDLKVERLEPVKTGMFERIEQAAFDPELYAEFSSSREEDLDEDPAENDTGITDKNRETTLGVRKQFATGTAIETDITHDDTRSDASGSEKTTRIGLSLTQSLLNGFGPSVNLARVKQARLDKIAGIHELKGFTERLVADTETAYWQYVLARKKIIIFKESLNISRKQKKEVEQQISVGILPKTEVAASRSEIALREQDLIDAQSLLEAHRLKLLHLIQPDDDYAPDISLKLTTSPDIETLPITNLNERILLSENLRSELKDAQIRFEQNRLETIITKNGLLPRLDFFVSLGRTSYGETFPETLRELDGNNTNDTRVGLSLSHDIFMNKSKGEHITALSNRVQSRLAVENLKIVIHLEVKLAVNEAERSRKQIKATRTTRSFQEQTCIAEKEKFKVGSSTALMVAQAERDLLAARIKEVEALVNYRIALVDLFLAEGSLLKMRGVKILSGDDL